MFRKNRNKTHPTQKPVELYEWLLKMYAKKGDKILDTHLGSGTIAIACYNAGINLTACEIDKNYFKKSLTKIKDHFPDIELNTNIQDAFAISFPNEAKSKNGASVLYKEQVEQLKLFKERKVKYKKALALV